MSQDNVHENEGVLVNDDDEQLAPRDSTGESVNPIQSNNSTDLQTNDVQRRRTEALERILMASDSNLSLPHPTARRLRFESARRLRGQHRNFLNRSILPRRDLERAIFIPFRTRSSMSAINLPTSQDAGSAASGPVVNMNEDASRRSGGNRPRINVSTFFMELTYSTAEPNGIHLLKNSTEGQKRRVEIHAANTMNIIKQYCPVKPHKMNQFRCCTRTQRDDLFDFKNVADKPLEKLDPTQLKCNTKVIVIIRDDTSGKWNNPFTSYFMNSLTKKHISPTCLTFQSETLLNTLVEQLNDDLHVFPKNTNANDPAFTTQAKKFLVMSTFTKLVANWNVPLLILDSCAAKVIALDEIAEFCTRFQIKLIDVDSNTFSGSNKQKKAGANKIRHQIRKALIESNIKRVGDDMKRMQKRISTAEIQHAKNNSTVNNIDSNLISEDCRRIVFNLHERMSMSLSHDPNKTPRHRIPSTPADVTARISLLEDEILADIENSDAFKCSRNVRTPGSSRSGMAHIDSGRTPGESRPKTSNSIYDECSTALPATQAHFSTPLVREQEKISELLFNELNQRWRIHGPQRFVPRTADAGPYCSGMSDSEKQLLITILQEVAYFETLKDIRNELKDSKKDLEGRLYGYNPDFANLIASAEEFLHGKAACMEPCKDELQFYKMPVSLVLSEAEVKYLRSKPPTYVVGQESPSQLIRVATEESTKLFMDAVIRTTCGARKLSSSRRNRTKVIIVIEDNNEALELLTVALWFFEKTPLATFQSKYYYNTSEFLLSLDACRFYYRSYPNHTSKKDEEHIFERWLGVGMNGILRSHQNKILLIDFPRLGTHFQNSKNILVNRLKLEEKLNNIKSFIIGKPSRKEDNLSTVEKLMDEIQKVLDPRDKLLFRKSRRMYMDLKLYKQIEQKSRQDLKALRDWGLPEPENEHDLWEKLRNSELVINNVQPSIEPDIITESCEVSELAESAYCDEDTSEVESVLIDKSDMSKKSGSDYANFLSECEESMESITFGEDHASATDDMHHYFTTLQFHASRSDSFGRCSHAINSQVSESSGSESDKHQSNFEMIESNSARIEKTPLESNILGGTKSVTERSHASKIKSPKIEAQDPHAGDMNATEGQHLRRSAGILNLVDKHSFMEKGKDLPKAKRDLKARKCYDVINFDIQTETFTKLEFTLPPKLTSDEGLSSSSSISPKEKQIKRKTPFSSVEINDNATNQENNNVKPVCDKNESENASHKQSLSNLCVAYISKWGKSLSRALHHKRTSPRKFPERLSFPFHQLPRTKAPKTKSRRSVPDVPELPRMQSENQNDAISSRSSSHQNEITQPTEKLTCDKRECSNQAWFRNLLNHFRVKANKRPMQEKTRNPDSFN